uniref:Kazal-like domain-containing protein n=1 Tax=Peronospora matthiolae TaxID=2874970 RepID=A0AAV1VI41_9STRA
MKLSVCILLAVAAAAVSPTHRNGVGAQPQPTMLESASGTTSNTPPKACDSDCVAEQGYVCGSDGQTYYDNCRLVAANCTSGEPIIQLSKGWCPGYSSFRPGTGFSNCTEDSPCVCGSDNVTYDNICKLEEAAAQTSKLTFAREGACDPVPDSPKPDGPSKEFEESCLCLHVEGNACGSDGVTYSSICDLVDAKCNDPTKADLEKVPCEEDLPIQGY